MGIIAVLRRIREGYYKTIGFNLLSVKLQNRLLRLKLPEFLQYQTNVRLQTALGMVSENRTDIGIEPDTSGTEKRMSVYGTGVNSSVMILINDPDGVAEIQGKT